MEIATSREAKVPDRLVALDVSRQAGWTSVLIAALNSKEAPEAVQNHAVSVDRQHMQTVQLSVQAPLPTSKGKESHA